MLFSGKQDNLCQLQGSLLQTLDEREDKAGYAVFRTQDDVPPPYSCTVSFLRQIQKTDNIEGKRRVGNSLPIKTCKVNLSQY